MARRIAFLLIAILIAIYYRWTARASGSDFLWGYDHLDGYYNFLGRAFARGHLYLEIQPSRELLAQPDPWDPRVPLSMKWHDMVLYSGRYYLYFGAAPALVVFTPYRLATGRDMPQNYALFLMCFAGFLFSCGAFLRMVDLASASPPAWLAALFVLTLGVCNGAPFLLNRAAHYELAIGGGYLFISAGMYFLAYGVGSQRAAWWLAASGLMFGLAVGSRPDLVFAGICAAAFLAWSVKRRDFVAYAAGFALVCAAIGWYNFERFGNPVEFGFRYQLSGPGMNRLDMSPRNWMPGLYYMLLAKPVYTGVFPWFRMVFRFPFDNPILHPLPPTYFIEPTVGALWLAPCIVATALLERRRWLKRLEAKTVRIVPAISSAAILLFLITTHLASHRYEVDFAPLAILAALTTICVVRSALPGWRRAAITAGTVLVLGYSIFANAAMGFSGPYDDIMRYRPQSYMRIVRRFSPIREYRPLLNPRIILVFTAAVFPESEGYSEPLVTTGHARFQYFLYLQHKAGGLRLVSQYEESKVAYDLDGGPTTTHFYRVVYSPAERLMHVEVDGKQAIVHPVPTLITAPAEITVGRDPSLAYVTAWTFTGRVQVLQKIVEE